MNKKIRVIGYIIVIAVFLWAAISDIAGAECKKWATYPPKLCGYVIDVVQYSAYETLAFCEDGRSVNYIFDSKKWVPFKSFDIEETKIVTDCFISGQCDDYIKRIDQAGECLDE